MERSASSAAISTELAVERARSAARRGDLGEAERLLRDLEAATGPSPAQLDLLARVHAQQERYDDADACWARLQADDPANEDAAAGRQQVADIVTGRRRARPVVSAGRVATAVALVCVLAAGAVIWGLTGTPVPPSDQVTTSSPGTGASTGAEDPAQRIKALAADLAFPGIRVTERPDSVEVVFDEGLFSGSDRLTADGEGVLAQLGERLTGHNVIPTIVGHTVTVPGGPDSGGSVVALARALIATKVLAESSDLPLTSFTLVTADQTDTPFTEPSRNRTVTLMVSPKDL